MSKSSAIVHLRLPQFLVDVYKARAKERQISFNSEIEQALFNYWEIKVQTPDDATQQKANQREIQKEREDKILHYIQYLTNPTLRDLGRYLPKVSKDTLKADLARLTEQGKLQTKVTIRTCRYLLPSKQK